MARHLSVSSYASTSSDASVGANGATSKAAGLPAHPPVSQPQQQPPTQSTNVRYGRGGMGSKVVATWTPVKTVSSVPVAASTQEPTRANSGGEAHGPFGYSAPGTAGSTGTAPGGLDQPPPGSSHGGRRETSGSIFGSAKFGRAKAINLPSNTLPPPVSTPLLGGTTPVMPSAHEFSSGLTAPRPFTPSKPTPDFLSGAEPSVPRSSKQAQLLGVTPSDGIISDWNGWNTTPKKPTSSGGLSANGGAGGVGIVGGVPFPDDSASQTVVGQGPLEVIAPWNAPAPSPYGANGLNGVDPFSSQVDLSREPAMDTKPRERTKSGPVSLLRGSKSAGALKKEQPPPPMQTPKTPESSIKEKKRGGFLGMLKKKSSKADFHQVDAHAIELPHPTFDTSALPAKLQARGDAVQYVTTSPTKAGKNTKPSKATRKSPSKGSSMSNDLPASMRQFTLDGTIALDTNLDEMEGIVNLDAYNMNASTQAPQTSNMSSRSPSFTGRDADGSPAAPPAMGLPRSSSVGNQMGTGGLGFDSALPRHLARRPSLAPLGSTGNGSRRSSVDFVLPPMEGRMNGERARSNLNTGTSISGSPISETGASPRSATRPGMGLRQPSSLSVEVVPPLPPAATQALEFRRGSVFPPAQQGNGMTVPHSTMAFTQPSQTAKDGAAAWTAPDSWAVRSHEAPVEADSSEDEKEGDDTDGELNESEAGSPESNQVGMFGAESESGTLGGRPGTRNGRPSASGTHYNKTFNVRIFRPDNSFSTINMPQGTSALELVTMLSRKFQVTSKTSHSLYLREKGLERRMGPNEKPIQLQRRRLEQAGYTEMDKLDDIGREDNSYLCRLVFKPQNAAALTSEEEMGESLEFVDLSARTLETIPIFLYKHAHEIVSLNLSKNRPFDLPTDFVQLCTTLRELVLSHMGIKRLPLAIKECPTLTRLDVSNNHIVDVEHIALDELVELTSLKCHNNRLSSLPEYFARFKQLKYLNMSNNKFSEALPAVVCKVTTLVELDVSFNTIQSIPAEIGQLKNLERLVLLANQLSTLPSTLSELVLLKEFDCRRNGIADLSSVSTSPKLEVLRCEFNQASIMEGSWPALRILSASNNSLTRFGLTGASNTLTSLNLSFAKLSTLPAEIFEHLVAVEHIVLDSNQIRVLPDTIGALTNLTYFSIRNNFLAELPVTIGKLQRLQTFHVSGNNLTALPSEIWACSQLNVLAASSNLLDEFPDPPIVSTSTTGLEAIEDIESRKLSTISKAASSASSRIVPPLALSLHKLYLGDNRLTDDVFAPISLMTEMRILNLSFNEIYEIPPSSLFKCQQLEELYLSGNKLTSLPPDDLERLVNLKLIYVNGNKLQTLPAELGKIKRLLALDVGSNVLKYNIANWPYDWNWNWNLDLRYLNLSGNKRLEIKPGHSNDTSHLPRSAKRRNLADFSALTKLHVLGLMDVTLMIPSLPDESEDRRVRTSLSEINDMGYGIADTLGTRVDTLSFADIVVPRFRAKDDEAIFGLFDSVENAPAGSRMVKYLHDFFTACLTLELSRLKAGELTSDALRRAFLSINRDFGNMLLPSIDSRRKDSEVSLSDRTSSIRTGAAGVIVYIRRKTLYVANSGNALAVISGRGGSARLIGKKHDPFESEEISRIRAAEGWISHRGYVNDEVSLSRAFGYYNVFPTINASPNVEEIELADTDEFVIIANSGLWEHISYQNAVDVARSERSDPMVAAAKLRDLAISYGCAQNVMVMVVSVGDLFKAKTQTKMHRGAAHGPEEESNFFNSRAVRKGKDEGAGERYLNLLEREVAPPVGMVALVFTDIRNSTALWESNPGMQTAIRMHNQLLRRQLRAIGGYEVKTEGDAFMVSFPTVASALLWCLTVQLELLREDWPQEILDSDEGKEIPNTRGEPIWRGLSVRMGIHWGNPVCEADPITRRMDYWGPMVNKASRISGMAGGGEIAVSRDVMEILNEDLAENVDERSDDGEEHDNPKDEWEDRDVMAIRRMGLSLVELGERKLKGLEQPEFITLVFPNSLRERASTEEDVAILEPVEPLLDVRLVQRFANLCNRLERVTTAMVHGEVPSAPPPHPLPQSMTDNELLALLSSQVSRVENVLSSLVLHNLGEFSEVLSTLEEVLKTNPRFIMSALSQYRRMLAAP